MILKGFIAIKDGLVIPNLSRLGSTLAPSAVNGLRGPSGQIS